MATKITNVYVKNRAAGETSYTEVDSVYAGGTKVFGTIYTTPVTPMGIIPLKRTSSDTGPYGGYRSLYTQTEMDTTISTAWGFLITPVYAYGSYYVPNSLDYFDYLTVTYMDIQYTTYNFRIPGLKSPRDGWIITEKRYTPEGAALFAPTLTETLYMPYWQNFSFETSQYCYLCNRDSVPLTFSARWFKAPYKRLHSGTSGSSPETIDVYVGRQDSSLGPGNLVKSQRAAEGRARTSTRKLFVN